MNQRELSKALINEHFEKAFMIADRLYWIFIGSLHPKHLDYYIEADPDNPQGTRNTERGRELFDELEEYVRDTI